MKTSLPFDAELLSRYDRPGPRYTSYPTAPQFTEGFGEEQLRSVALDSNEAPIPAPLSLYLHIPYCFSPCFYCGCNRVITRDRSKAGSYLQHLTQEIDMAARLFDKDREVTQIHLGGGTPNFLDTSELQALMTTLQQTFCLSKQANRDFSIELDPRHVTADSVAAMAAIGFNRASLGVQDFDPEVQRAVNRLQGVEETLAVIEACRSHGFRSINVDLIYGLPRQTLEGFERTLDQVLTARPQRLAIYGYAHLPSLFRAQRQINDADLPSAEVKLALLQLAVTKLTESGYCYIGMDHFSLPDDELALAQRQGSLHRNFMGYTTHAYSDLIGLGASSISHIGSSYSQNRRDVPAWEAALQDQHLPVWRGMLLSGDDELRAELIQDLMCHGRIDIHALEARHEIDFRRYFAEDLQRMRPLIDDGLVVRSIRGYQVTERGRLLIRVVAACFDRYLHSESKSQSASYSKSI